MIPPLLAEADTDRRLRGAPLHVLLHLHTKLAYGEYRKLKHWAVSQDIGISRRRASQAIALLVELGYLRAGVRTERNVGSYMLLSSRGEPAQQRPAA